MTSIGFVQKDYSALRPWLTAIALPLAMSLLLAIVGAFGSYFGMRLPVRLAHFASNAIAIGGLAAAATLVVQRYLFAGRHYPLWVAVVIAFTMAIPGGWIVQGSLRIWAPQVIPHVTFQELVMQVLAINLLIGTIAWCIQRRRLTAVSAKLVNRHESTDGCDPTPREDGSFRMKLPPTLRRATVLALSAEDHYLRVRTDRGSALILMSLSQAIISLGPEAGIRIHRSHWVSRHTAIKHAERIGKSLLPIDDETVLPISRAGRTLMRDLKSRS